jgi:hypothetical protein
MGLVIAADAEDTTDGETTVIANNGKRDNGCGIEQICHDEPFENLAP